MARTRRGGLVAALLLALPALACGGGTAAGGDDVVLVFAAASLADAFEDVAAAFEAANPGSEVELNVAGSPALRAQVLDGAPADVLAPADPAHLQGLQLAGGGPVPVFARNRLQLVVPAGNPGGVAGLADLARGELLVGLCADGVPCGDLARTALARAGIEVALDTAEPDARALLAKVRAGELDVGVVYRTDVAAAGAAVEGIDLPPDLAPAASYPIAVLAGARPQPAAASFAAFVLGPAGRAILADHGFELP